MSDKVRLAILARSLEIGGAERQMVELVKKIDLARFDVKVCLFYARGELLSDVVAIDAVEIADLKKRSRWDVFLFFGRLIKTLWGFKADVILSYLDVPNIVAVLVGKLIGARVVVSVRATNMDFSRYDWVEGAVYRLSAGLARFADRVIVNSCFGLDYHHRNGFPRAKMVVIPNGIDTARFAPNMVLRQVQRTNWTVEEDQVLIGIVGRLDPMKDHPTFLQMAEILVKKHPRVRFVCVGDGPESYRRELLLLARKLVSSSLTESFSNVIGEAMACGVPCVVTDVGDSARIVGDVGVVVPAQSPSPLASAVINLLMMSSEKRREWGSKARRRIVSEYSLERMVAATEALLNEVAAT